MMIKMTNSSTATSAFNDQINALIMHAFGFSFDKWHNGGYWTDDYMRYSIIESGVMLSNISAYKMKLLINGLPWNCLQLGSIATRQGHRGKGLSRKIMEHIFDIYPQTPIFLQGDNDALDYYLKMGFKPFVCKQPYMDCKLSSTDNKLIKLDVKDPKVDVYLRGRQQYSQLLDCKNQYEINWFHILYRFSDNLYEIPQLNAMLVAEQKGSILTIHDIAAAKPVSFSEIMPYLNFEGVDRIQFGFNPDWLEVDYHMGEYESDDSTPLIKGDFGVNGEFIIPTMITT